MSASAHSLFDRWDEASRNAQEHLEDPKRAAGRRAEYEVTRELGKRLDGTGWEVKANIRVPDPTQQRRREIDFVITSPTSAVIVELKYWTGSVSLDENENVIQAPRREGAPINHGRLFADVAERVDILCLHHASLGGSVVPIKGYVVFYDVSGKLKLAPSVAERGDVITYSQLLSTLPEADEAASTLQRILFALLHFFGFREKKKRTKQDPSPEIASLRKSLDTLGSWDVVELNGGKVLLGDILSKVDGASDAPCLDRSRFGRLEFEIDRSRLKALFRQPAPQAKIRGLARDGSWSEWSLSTAAVIDIHEAGQRVVTRQELRSLKRLEFGYSTRPDFHFRFSDLFEGRLLVGTIQSTYRGNIFVDVGLRDAAGRRRDAFVKQAAKWGDNSVGRRVLVRVEQLIKTGEKVRVALVGQPSFVGS